MSHIDRDARDGVTAGLAAYLMWGFLPVYFVLVREVDPTEVLAHRVIWAVPFGALILSFRRQWAEVGRALTHRAMLGWLSLSAIFIGMNWFVYIWAIQDGRILETSLGYYINPLTNMLVGYFLFGERLRRFQGVAVALAAIGVTVVMGTSSSNGSNRRVRERSNQKAHASGATAVADGSAGDAPKVTCCQLVSPSVLWAFR